MDVTQESHTPDPQESFAITIAQNPIMRYATPRGFHWVCTNGEFQNPLGRLPGEKFDLSPIPEKYNGISEMHEAEFVVAENRIAKQQKINVITTGCWRNCVNPSKISSQAAASRAQRERNAKKDGKRRLQKLKGDLREEFERKQQGLPAKNPFIHFVLPTPPVTKRALATPAPPLPLPLPPPPSPSPDELPSLSLFNNGGERVIFTHSPPPTPVASPVPWRVNSPLTPLGDISFTANGDFATRSQTVFAALTSPDIPGLDLAALGPPVTPTSQLMASPYQLQLSARTYSMWATVIDAESTLD